MSYRQSSYDPLATSGGGKPLRPFNRVQWTGVVLEVVGGLGFVAYLFGMGQIISPVIGNASPFIMLSLVGMLLINSRREPVADPALELAAARRKWLLITVAVCAAFLGLAAVLSLKGY